MISFPASTPTRGGGAHDARENPRATGAVRWLTGLSGAGKSSIAAAVADLLRAMRIPTWSSTPRQNPSRRRRRRYARWQYDSIIRRTASLDGTLRRP
jgi:ABC-type glutathione transport system ATPase component